MARKKTNAPMMHSALKCQVRLAVARNGVRVLAIAAPNTPDFAQVRVWPDKGDAEREVVLKGGSSAITQFPLESDEVFWVEVVYGTAKRKAVQIKYEPKSPPFGYRPAEVKNPARIDLAGSVPRIREQPGRYRRSAQRATS